MVNLRWNYPFQGMANFTWSILYFQEGEGKSFIPDFHHYKIWYLLTNDNFNAKSWAGWCNWAGWFIQTDRAGHANRACAPVEPDG